MFLSRAKIASEVYPFAPWKLFSNPSGSNLEFEAFKVYGVKGNDSIQLSLNKPDVFSANKHVYAIQYYTSRIYKNEDPELNKKKLRLLFEGLRPHQDFEQFILKKEIVNPILLENKEYQPESQIELILK